jgi:small subunit ribosomal protein S8
MMTDLVADMLTRVRNALRNREESVTVVGSKLNCALAGVLKREGYIRDFAELETKPQTSLKVYLKYGPDGEDVIQDIQRESRPGCRVYRGVEDLGTVMNGLGIFVVSTPQGVLSDRECRRQRVGGEVLCRVW